MVKKLDVIKIYEIGESDNTGGIVEESIGNRRYSLKTFFNSSYIGEHKIYLHT